MPCVRPPAPLNGQSEVSEGTAAEMKSGLGTKESGGQGEVTGITLILQMQKSRSQPAAPRPSARAGRSGGKLGADPLETLFLWLWCPQSSWGAGALAQPSLGSTATPHSAGWLCPEQRQACRRARHFYFALKAFQGGTQILGARL